MARQPNSHDAPDRLSLRPLTDQERLDLRKGWSDWHQAWANCSQNPSGHNQLELESTCDRTEARYGRLIAKFEPKD